MHYLFLNDLYTLMVVYVTKFHSLEIFSPKETLLFKVI